VLDRLEMLPNFANYFSESAKEGIKYNLWQRPTISWKLSCEQTESRENVTKAARSERDKSDSMHETAIIIMLSIAFGGGILIGAGLLMIFFNGYW